MNIPRAKTDIQVPVELGSRQAIYKDHSLCVHAWLLCLALGEAGLILTVRALCFLLLRKANPPVPHRCSSCIRSLGTSHIPLK